VPESALELGSTPDEPSVAILAVVVTLTEGCLEVVVEGDVPDEVSVCSITGDDESNMITAA
jgi:hypothetical protein